jgi:hypothetical protein
MLFFYILQQITHEGQYFVKSIIVLVSGPYFKRAVFSLMPTRFAQLPIDITDGSKEEVKT